MGKNGQPNGQDRTPDGTAASGQNPLAPLGKGPVRVGSLDMSDGTDRKWLTRQRWKITPAHKGRLIAALQRAMELAVEKDDQRTLADIVRTAAMLERQNQADEHKALDLTTQRNSLDEIQIRLVQVDQPRLGTDDDDTG